MTHESADSISVSQVSGTETEEMLRTERLFDVAEIDSLRGLT